MNFKFENAEGLSKIRISSLERWNLEEGEEQKQKQKLEVELGRRGRKLQKPKNVLASELQKPRNECLIGSGNEKEVLV